MKKCIFLLNLLNPLTIVLQLAGCQISVHVSTPTCAKLTIGVQMHTMRSRASSRSGRASTGGGERCDGACTRSTGTSSWPRSYASRHSAPTVASSSGEYTTMQPYCVSSRTELLSRLDFCGGRPTGLYSASQVQTKTQNNSCSFLLSVYFLVFISDNLKRLRGLKR